MCLTQYTETGFVEDIMLSLSQLFIHLDLVMDNLYSFILYVSARYKNVSLKSLLIKLKVHTHVQKAVWILHVFIPWLCFCKFMHIVTLRMNYNTILKHWQQ